MEKRRDKRMKVKMDLEISSLFKQDNVVLEQLNSPIEVTDVSKSGIGFRSKDNLPIGYYFNSCIQLGKEDAKLYCVVKIIRQEPPVDSVYTYGCQFVGMAPVLSYIFDDFAKNYEEEIEN